MKIMHFWRLQFGKFFSGGRNLTGKIACNYLGKSCLNINKKKYRFLDIKRRCFPKQELKIVKLVPNSRLKMNLAILRLPGGFLTAVSLSQEAQVTLKLYSTKKIVNDGSAIAPPILLNFDDEHFTPSFSGICQSLPVGSIIYNIEIFPGTGAKIARSPGVSAVYLSSNKRHNRSVIRMKTGEIRRIHKYSIVCFGTVSNSNHFLFRYKNAGAARRAGKRPVVRASAKNPVDHPMGGRTKGGCQPVSQSGILSRGPATRHQANIANSMIILYRRKVRHYQ